MFVILVRVRNDSDDTPVRSDNDVSDAWKRDLRPDLDNLVTPYDGNPSVCPDPGVT